MSSYTPMEPGTGRVVPCSRCGASTETRQKSGHAIVHCDACRKATRARYTAEEKARRNASALIRPEPPRGALLVLPTGICTDCFNLAHRRPADGCPTCRGEYAEPPPIERSPISIGCGLARAAEHMPEAPATVPATMQSKARRNERAALRRQQAASAMVTA